MIVVEVWETGEIEEYDNYRQVFWHDVKVWGWKVALYNLFVYHCPIVRNRFVFDEEGC